ncbi:MAG: hypothetical protein GY876_02990 [Planctomycetes bacterium]|nr:hypothetical protein [Planctomycetota bacterium]
MLRMFLLPLILASTACAPVLKGPLDSPGSEAAKSTLDHGYGLLCSLLQQESSVTLIFGIKHASKPSEELVRQIGDAAANGLRRIQELRVDPPKIDLTMQGLPLVEVSARNLIMNKEAAALLLAGDSFEVRLLLSQQKVCDYAAALATSLAAIDTNDVRRGVLEALAGEFTTFDETLRSRICKCQSSSSNLGS